MIKIGKSLLSPLLGVYVYLNVAVARNRTTDISECLQQRRGELTGVILFSF